MWTSDCDDPSLVAASLGGDRDAFARIVTRYQALVASIAYSATGNLSQSEDLAQDTFVAAWKDLKALREPQKLRAWLCGIARRTTANALRKQQRQPVHGASLLDAESEIPTPEAIPVERAMNREEEAILWRSLEQIPETYREPLILFYRENQSIGRVAQDLELSEDAVRQRLSRGRKLLEERVTAFVEGALRLSAPKRAFTLGVMGALSVQMTTTSATAAAAVAAKGGATTKAAAWLMLLNSFAGLFTGLFTSYLGYKMAMDNAESDQERRVVKRFFGLLAVCVLFPLALLLVAVWGRAWALSNTNWYVALVFAAVLCWVPAVLALLLWSKGATGGLTGVGPSLAAQPSSPAAAAPFEYKSQSSWLGWPLLHIRFGGAWASRQRPVKAWIAIGDVAFGRLVAFGGFALAPICVGGVSVGLLVFGGFSAGVLCYAGFGLGFWTMGGLVLGQLALGGCAIGWKAAVGGVAIAREFAQGGVAVALHANDGVADSYLSHHLFFMYSYRLLTKWLWPTMLLSTVPSVLMWWAMRTRRQR